MIRESKNFQKTRDPMGEKNPLVKSHISGDEIDGKILMFRGWNCWMLWRS